MMRHLVVVTAMVFAGCTQGLRVGEVPPPTKEFLSDAARKELQLPSPGEPTTANATDMKYVGSIGNDVRQTVEDFLKPSKVKASIYAARPVGAYLLLWVSFAPTVMDGGTELIYSVEKKKIVGYFNGGGISG